MKILVVGGAGYIGSHMVKCLHENGHHVVVCDDLSTGHRGAVLHGDFYHCSIGDSAQLSRIFEEHQIEAVMHFAARSIVAHSVKDPLSFYLNNVAQTANLLSVMKQYEVKKIVFSSTAAVYGEPKSAIIDESHPTVPINPYGQSKAFAERVIKDCCDAYGFRAVVPRYFNAAGADASGIIGESHEPETHLIPRLLKKAQGEEIDLAIFGDDYDTADGTCVRDYVHVGDIADAHMKAVHFMRDHAGFHVFNLGGGLGYSVKQIVSAAVEVTGVPLQATIAPRRIGDPAILVASNKLAWQSLNWRPEINDIKKIIQSAWQWHQAPRY